MPDPMTFEAALARLSEKLPTDFEFQLERAAGRDPVSDAERRERKLTPFDNFALSIECWARFEQQTWTGPVSQLDQAVGVALDAVRTWQDAGEPAPAPEVCCHRCLNTGLTKPGGELCDCGRAPF